ncbi:hypothetical protein [Persicobacter psychrovividus]|uniref:Uncharacterized protein n=1 Tax=Persicobacter psychrovividus TaxID=387638 RepID=A0ABM7VGB0_9BACT|nr:hypothetical protein PEPS_22740 [Persicobacter psychrovividus]
MKLPSLFKIPKHQQFNVKPRYYDPVKEHVEERRRIVEQQMAREARGESDAAYASSIREGFQRNRKKNSPVRAGMAQGLMVIGLISSVLIYWFYGDWAFYFFGIFIAAYIYLKVKGIL